MVFMISFICISESTVPWCEKWWQKKKKKGNTSLLHLAGCMQQQTYGANTVANSQISENVLLNESK